MRDFEMMCELIARKVFQCGSSSDPLGCLTNADSWLGLSHEDYSAEHKCMAWAIIARLKSNYLDSSEGREQLFERAKKIELGILNSTSNQSIRQAMEDISKLVEELNLQEYPHISYRSTNN